MTHLRTTSWLAALLIASAAPAAAADSKFDPEPELTGDRAAATALMYRLNQLAMACEDGVFRGRIVVEAKLDAAGQITSVTTAPAVAAIQRCFERPLRGGKFPASAAGAAVRRPFNFAGCNPFRLEERADREFAAGRYAQAVRTYTDAYACDEGLVQHEVEHAKVLLAACLAGDTAKARHYFRLLPDAERRRFEPICAQHGVASLARGAGTPPAETKLRGCDTAKMAAVAERWAAAGKRSEAVRQFSDTLRCGVQRDLALRATEVACEARETIYAIMFAAMLDPADRAGVAQGCSKQGITL